MPEPVVITGIGIVSPIGNGARAFAKSIRAGRSGVGPISAFDCRGFDTRIAAELDEAALEPEMFVKQRKQLKLMSRAALFAVVAAGMARRESHLDPEDVDPVRLGVSMGVGGMGPVDVDSLLSQAESFLQVARDTDGTFLIPAFAKAYRERTNPIFALRGLPNLAAAHVAIQNSARGPNKTVATACTAGTQAIGDGLRLIQHGEADAVLAGGSDAMINPIGVLGFSMLGTLSRRNEDPGHASRPFDRDRDGFVIGEGAAVVVLEREAFARARGATVLAELAGYATTSDAYRITDERPDASGAVQAMQLCLRDAEAAPSDVGYINAHGTGTRMNDPTETEAIKEVFGAGARSIPVSSTKSMIGHTLAAAGAIELSTCVLAMNEGFVPPTINLDHPDPDCDLDYVPNRSRPLDFTTALSNSFGFGGQNACLMIRRR